MDVSRKRTIFKKSFRCDRTVPVREHHKKPIDELFLIQGSKSTHNIPVVPVSGLKITVIDVITHSAPFLLNLGSNFSILRLDLSLFPLIDHVGLYAATFLRKIAM